MKRSLFLLMLIAIGALIGLSGCTAEPQDITNCVSGEPANFWYGLWHGIIAPITFIISLFTDTMTVYEVNNNGGWYDFGFLLGVGAFTSGGAAGAKRARR